MLNLPPLYPITDARLERSLSTQVRRFGEAGFPLVQFRGKPLEADAQMAELAAERRTQADVRAMRGCLAELEESLADPARYGARVDRMARLVARATKNPLYEMFAAYNAHVARELGTALLVIRPPSREHLDGMRILVDVIDQKESAAARRLVTEFHAWGTPRILAAASLASGESLRRIAKEMER